MHTVVMSKVCSSGLVGSSVGWWNTYYWKKNSTFYLTCTFLAWEDSISVDRGCTREKGAVLCWAGWLVELMGLAWSCNCFSCSDLLFLLCFFLTAKYAIWNWLINYLTFLFVTIVWRELATTSSSPQTDSYFIKAKYVRNFLSSAYLLDSLFLSVKHANTNTMTELVRRLHELVCLASSRLTFPSCPWKHEV